MDRKGNGHRYNVNCPRRDINVSTYHVLMICSSRLEARAFSLHDPSIFIPDTTMQTSQVNGHSALGVDLLSNLPISQTLIKHFNSLPF